MVEKPAQLPEPDDASLIQQAQQGDRAAFNQLIGKYQDKIFAVARGLLRDYHEAQEAMQETLLSAYQSLKNFRGDSSFLTWLIAIARNKCLNRRRSWARRKKVIISASEQAVETKDGEQVRLLDAPDPALDPAQQAIRAEQQQLLRAAIEQLDEPSRQVVKLHFEGLSHEEIVQAVNCPLGTVKSRLSRALARLKTLLKEQTE